MIIDYPTEKVSVRCTDRSLWREILAKYQLYEYVFHFCVHAGIASRSAHETGCGYPFENEHFDLPAFPVSIFKYVQLTIDGQSIKVQNVNELKSLLSFAAGIPQANEATFEAWYSYLATDFDTFGYGWDTEFHPAHVFFEVIEDDANTIPECIQLSTIINNGSFEDDPFDFISSPFGTKEILVNDKLPWADEMGTDHAEHWLGEWVTLFWDFRLPVDNEKKLAVEEANKRFCPKYNRDNVYDTCDFDDEDSETHGAPTNVSFSTEDIPDFLSQLNNMQKLTAQVSEGSNFIVSGAFCSEDPETAFSVAKLVQNDDGHISLKFVNL